MSTNKFFRNVKVARTNPLAVSYPATVVIAEVSEQSSLVAKCEAKDCYLWLVVSEKQFSLEDKQYLPSSHLQFFTEKIPLVSYELRAFVGKFSRERYKGVLDAVKSPISKRYLLSQVGLHPEILKTMEMYFLGATLKVAVVPMNVVAWRNGGLHITILGALTNSTSVF